MKFGAHVCQRRSWKALERGVSIGATSSNLRQKHAMVRRISRTARAIREPLATTAGLCLQTCRLFDQSGGACFGDRDRSSLWSRNRTRQDLGLRFLMQSALTGGWRGPTRSNRFGERDSEDDEIVACADALEAAGQGLSWPSVAHLARFSIGFSAPSAWEFVWQRTSLPPATIAPPKGWERPSEKSRR